MHSKSSHLWGSTSEMIELFGYGLHGLKAHPMRLELPQCQIES